MRWAGHEACVEELSNAYRNVYGRHSGKKRPGRSTHMGGRYFIIKKQDMRRGTGSVTNM
jgi:hypothetical protein